MDRNTLVHAFEFAVAVCGIGIAMVASLAIIEWATADSSDLLGYDITDDEPCRRCDKRIYRCGLCTDCYEEMLDTVGYSDERDGRDGAF